MTKLIISFDTEDYTNPHAADGILKASKIVRDAGFRPCHNVVAWLAEALEKWGRQDALDEMRQCEITTHSLKHSYHPTINEYTDIEDFDEAMRRFRLEEDECIEILKKYFGDIKFPAACAPGNSCSYVAQYGYADMGIPLYDGGMVIDPIKNRPVSFCNILNIDYNNHFDLLGYKDKAYILDLIERMADHDIWIFYHHPARSIYKEYVDVLNYNGKNNEGEPIFGERHSDETIAKFEENLKFFLEQIKNDDRFEVVNYKDIAEQYAEHRVVKPRHISEIKKALDEEFFPVTLPLSLSISDIMLTCRDFLLGKDEHVCGKVYGFLDVPYAVPHPVKVTKDELIASCAQIKDGEFLPTSIEVGGKKLGPADWVRAALTVLYGNDNATVVPDKWQIDLNEFHALRDQNYKGTWMHSPDFEDKYISDRCRLQAWTIRLPYGTKRKIY